MPTETTGRTADPSDDLTEKLDALIRSTRENTEIAVELRLAAAEWNRQWRSYSGAKYVTGYLSRKYLDDMLDAEIGVSAT